MSVEVRPVSSRRDLNTFIKLPWRLYRDEPNWVAPLLTEPVDGPFGRTFTLRDPDGYAITIHDKGRRTQPAPH